MTIGKWIIVSFVMFAAFIATLVTICVRQDISLVSPDYYKEELGYEKQIERLNNTSSLPEKPIIHVVSGSLEVAYRSFADFESGELKLFCPSNEKMDRNYKVQTTEQSIQIFEIGGLQKGMYKARLVWTMNGKQFYQEEVIYL